MPESKLKGPFVPVESGVMQEGSLEVPRVSQKKSAAPQPRADTPHPDTPPPVVDGVELLPGEVEYAQLQTLHLEQPQAFPKSTEEVRASMYPKLQELNKNCTPEDKKLSSKIDFYSKAKKLFTRKDDPLHDDALGAYADQLYRTYLRGHSLAETMYNLFLLLNIHNTIAVSIGRVPRVRIQMLASALVDAVLIHHDITSAQFPEIDSILQGIGGDLGEGFKRIVGNRIADYVKVRSYAEQLHQRMSPHHESLQTLRAELQQMGDEFMENIRNLRQYGIKSSYYQDGFLHDVADAWVITDINDILSRAESRRGIVALIALANKDALIGAGNLHYDWKTDAVSLRYESSYPADASFFLKWDGALHDVAPDRHLHAEEIFKRAGAEAEYEMVRVSFLARIHDLVVPLELTRELPPLDELEQLFSRRGGEQGDREDIGAVIQKILLPRIRLNADNRVTQLLDEDRERRNRPPREHDVTEFTRQLPAGHHPSPQAIALAREYNFILDPTGNRTFVQPHTRGKGGTGFLHELKEK